MSMRKEKKHSKSVSKLSAVSDMPSQQEQTKIKAMIRAKTSPRIKQTQIKEKL